MVRCVYFRNIKYEIVEKVDTKSGTDRSGHRFDSGMVRGFPSKAK